jgi:hypothetical protein
MEDEILKDESFENAVTVINSYSKDKMTRKFLLRNLASGAKQSEIKRLREYHRLLLIKNLQEDM